MELTNLVNKYKEAYGMRKKVKQSLSGLNKEIKGMEADIMIYLESNNIKKLPIEIEGKTMYFSINNKINLI